MPHSHAPIWYGRAQFVRPAGTASCPLAYEMTRGLIGSARTGRQLSKPGIRPIRGHVPEDV
jgi:hypothetical protein